MSETILEVQHLGKSFGNNEILKDIDFSVKPKDVTCIIGPSGSGKSTLLRCMNLLETPSCGEIRYHGTNIMDKHVNVPEYRSKVGMVFQNFNLFNNMTVLKNCTVGQEKVLKKSKEEAYRNAMMYLEKVGMAPYINAKPKQLSGGQKQRVAIARALAMEPEILICDEPTTALDVTIQAQILDLIKKLKKEKELTIIFITHDLGVVANMADRIAVMYAGKIVEYGDASDVFYDPRHPYTWALLESMPSLATSKRLSAIPGTPPNMIYPPKGDAFAARNHYAMKIDFERQPPFFKVNDNHYAATWLLHPDAPKIENPLKNRYESQRKLHHIQEDGSNE